MAEFVEADGDVHVMNPDLAEFTLCGDAFDLDAVEAGYEQKPTRKRRVTCGRCARIILGVRDVQVSRAQHQGGGRG